MNSGKKKDALTDLVDVASKPDSSNSDARVNDGQAVTSSGEVVTLGFDKEIERDIERVARKIVNDINKRK